MVLDGWKNGLGKLKFFFIIKKSADLYVVAVVGVERDVTEL